MDKGLLIGIVLLAFGTLIIIGVMNVPLHITAYCEKPLKFSTGNYSYVEGTSTLAQRIWNPDTPFISNPKNLEMSGIILNPDCRYHWFND